MCFDCFLSDTPAFKRLQPWPEAVGILARGRASPGQRPCAGYLSWPKPVRTSSWRPGQRRCAGQDPACWSLLIMSASTLLRLRNDSASRRDMYLGASRASMLKSCGVGMRPMTVWVATSESSGFPPMTVWVSPSRSTTAPRIGFNLIGKGDANSGGIGELW